MHPGSRNSSFPSTDRILSIEWQGSVLKQNTAVQNYFWWQFFYITDLWISIKSNISESGVCCRFRLLIVFVEEVRFEKGCQFGRPLQRAVLVGNASSDRSDASCAQVSSIATSDSLFYVL